MQETSAQGASDAAAATEAPPGSVSGRATGLGTAVTLTDASGLPLTANSSFLATIAGGADAMQNGNEAAVSQTSLFFIHN